MFATTRWSLVLAAGTDDADARVALEQLCRIYRPAVLAWLRGRGYSRSDAEDLTQGFFARFIEKRLHETADRERGRFRTYLRTALHHFAVNAAEFEHAARRHGGTASEADPESLAASDGEAPDRAVERAWALALARRAKQRLQGEAAEADKGALFARLQSCLIEPPDTDAHARIAADFAARPNTIAVAAHRLRQRPRALVHEESPLTVADAAEIESEYACVAVAKGMA